MTEESFPFQELVQGDRTVTAAMFAKQLSIIRSRGVILLQDDELQVSASSPAALSIDVGTGAAFVGASELRAYRNTLARTLTIAAADPTNPRHDLVVLDLDTNISPATPPTLATHTGTSGAQYVQKILKLRGGYASLLDPTAAQATLTALETRLSTLEANTHTHTPTETAGPAQPTA